MHGPTQLLTTGVHTHRYEERSFPVGAHTIQLLVSPSACSALGFLGNIEMRLGMSLVNKIKYRLTRSVQTYDS